MNVLQQASIVGLVFVALACGDTPSASTPAAQPAPSREVTAPVPAAASEQNGVNARGAAFKAFQDRVRAYVDFHNNVQKMVPALTETNNPEKISAREKALGDQLIKSRPNAKQGDFFIKEVQPYLVEIIKQDFAKRSVADRKALIVELPKGVKVDINVIYPTVLPLATFPPNLLKVMPELPPELEYRIVARHLLLRDVKGNVVVDLMRDVFPIPM